MSLKKHIPNFITLCNLLCGCLSVVFAAEGNLIWAAYLIFIATLFDFGDGLAARALKVQSEVGKQLDSLADMVTFGFAPGFLIYNLLSLESYIPPTWILPTPNEGSLWIDYNPESFEYHTFWNLFIFTPFLIPLFSALRLAKFNVDESQTTEFKGLATPANALFFAGLVLALFTYQKQLSGWPMNIGGQPESRWEASTPLDENNPETMKSLKAYLDREQYGSWPILDSETLEKNADSTWSHPKNSHFPRMYGPDSLWKVDSSELEKLAMLDSFRANKIKPQDTWPDWYKNALSKQDSFALQRMTDAYNEWNNSTSASLWDAGEYVVNPESDHPLGLTDCFGINRGWHATIYGPKLLWILGSLCLIFSLLLVAPIRMFSFKFKNMGWQGNEVRYLFMGIALLTVVGSLLINNLFLSVPIIILLYIVTSMVNNLIRKD